MRFSNIILTMLIATCRLSVAAPHVFQDHNFAIEFPSNWRTVDPSPPQTLAASQSSDGSKTIVIIATKDPENERFTSARDITAGAKQSFTDKGLPITNEHQTSVNGVPFHTFTTQVSATASVVIYTASAEDEVYLIQGVCKAADAASDPEVLAVINSFHLLSPRTISIETSRPNTPAYRAGYITGQLLLIVLIGAGVVWLIRRVISKCKIVATSPPLPQPQKKSFFHHAATGSAFSPLLAFALAFLLSVAQASLNPQTRRMLSMTMGIAASLIILVGLMFGILALFGIPKYGKKGILWKALTGIIINLVFVVAAILPIMRARELSGLH